MNLALLAVVVVSASIAEGLGHEDGFSLELATPHAWTAQPGWLSHPAAQPMIRQEGSAVCFAVAAPGQGMKWSRSVRGVWLADSPYLVLEYSAWNLDTASADYAVHLQVEPDGRELIPLRLKDLRADGKRHAVAVDVSALCEAAAIRLIAVQVQATAAGDARLVVEHLAFADAPPAAATVLGELRPAAPDVVLPLTGGPWTAQPAWLDNSATLDKVSTAVAERSIVFRVEQITAGMKWSARLSQSVALGNHRLLCVRYRAKSCSAHSDYAVAVLGKRRQGDESYRPLILPADLQADGRWHWGAADLRPAAAELATLTGLACQVRAVASPAWMEIGEVWLSNTLPVTALADCCETVDTARWDGFAVCALHDAANANLACWLGRLRLTGWPRGPATFEGIPFDLQGDRVAATTLWGQQELRIAMAGRASEVGLLVLAAMAGADEPVFGEAPLRHIGDVDRFRLRLEYADGVADECLPLNVAAGTFGVAKGAQVLVASADPRRELRALVLKDATAQAAFAIAGVTRRTAGPLFPQAAQDLPPLAHRTAVPAADSVFRATATERGTAIQDGVLDAELPAAGPPRLARLRHAPTGRELLAAPSELVELALDGRVVSADQWIGLPVPAGAAGQTKLVRRYGIRGREDVAFELVMESRGAGALGVSGRLVSRADRPCKASLMLRVGPYRLADRREDEHYFYPKRGAAFDGRDCRYRERYCGTYPLQFVDTFAPAVGCGLSLRTACRAPVLRWFRLEKNASGLVVGVEYPAAEILPRASYDWPEAIFAVTDGQWRRGLEEYRRWLATWQRPLGPRQEWFRGVFNFRQRFLHNIDPLCDGSSGQIRLERAVDEAREHFGGIDYLHLFDWGDCPPYGRIYGRVGDHSPFDALRGGQDALRQAIAGVQAQHVPVGLYIEGYLLEEKGKLGQRSGKAWQLIGQAGKGLYWPECTEMYVCAGVAPWRQVQAATYAEKVRQLGVDGMYLDEYGFAGPGVDCWSKDHGHAVPSFAVAEERETTRLVREAIDGAKRGVVLYTEETPVDLTAAFQDGSFTYAMSDSRRTATQVPLNAARLALPDFKTIEILICDKPTGSWATGVKWVFFNGEAIWLEGPAEGWFERPTREAIRRCYRLLHAHRDAFTGLDPVPLVETLAGGVFCNAFRCDGKTVYTFYNARHRTFRGDILALPWQEAASYEDAWHGRPAAARRDGLRAIVPLEIGPHDVGCLVVRAGPRER